MKINLFTVTLIEPSGILDDDPVKLLADLSPTTQASTVLLLQSLRKKEGRQNIQKFVAI